MMICVPDSRTLRYNRIWVASLHCYSVSQFHAGQCRVFSHDFPGPKLVHASHNRPQLYRDSQKSFCKQQKVMDLRAIGRLRLKVLPSYISTGKFSESFAEL